MATKINVSCQNDLIFGKKREYIAHVFFSEDLGLNKILIKHVI